jgi:hypothetical protein
MKPTENRLDGLLFGLQKRGVDYSLPVDASFLSVKISFGEGLKTEREGGAARHRTTLDLNCPSPNILRHIQMVASHLAWIP